MSRYRTRHGDWLGHVTATDHGLLIVHVDEPVGSTLRRGQTVRVRVDQEVRDGR